MLSSSDISDNSSTDSKRKEIKVKTNIKSNTESFVCNNKVQNKEIERKLCNKCGKLLCALYKHKCQNSTKAIDKKLACDACGKMFQKYGSFWSHKKNCHKTKKLELSCSVCNKVYHNASVLREHRLTKHSNNPMPHICHVCKKGFPTTTKMKRHMIIHNIQRPHQCNKCASSYSQKVKLQIHIKEIHSCI